MKFLSRNPTFGLDIGTRNIKGIQLKKKGTSIKLENYFFHDIYSNTENKNSEIKIQESLSAIVNLHKLKYKSVASTINDFAFSNYEFLLPNIPDNELRKAIEFELSSKIDYAMDQATFDFYPISRSKKDPRFAQQTIKVFCARKNAILNQINRLKTVDLKPSVLDIDILAITAMLEFNEYTHEDANFILINIGESHTTTALIVDHQILFVSIHPSGLGTIYKIIQDEYKITFSETDQYVQNINLISNPSEFNEIQKRLDQLFIILLTPIQQSIDYFKVHSKDFPISEIFITGGGAIHKEICTIFEQHYQIKCQIPNPFRKIDIFKKEEEHAHIPPFEKLTPFMATAVGLALGGIE